jgi:16S rRNA (uracil1498-N3)-methyltransferase
MDRRFYSDDEFAVDQTVQLSTEESRHLKTVLRASVGENILLMDGRGGMAEAEVVDLGGKRGAVTCRVTSLQRMALPADQIHLYVAPPRGKGMATIVRTATEMGAAAITPILCRRGTGRPNANAVDGWRATAIAAVKQSINPFLPQLHPPVPLDEVLKAGPAPGIVGWIPDESGAPPSDLPSGGKVSLFIGPEGGFDPDEISAILEAGIRPASFGPWVLRVETAVVAGMAILNRKGTP